jgi:hypothetical protein
MGKKGVKLSPNERSTTRGTDTSYSIFNGSEGKGFCIVSNGNVIGYDTENTVEDDNVPCCFKELLNVISKTVTTSKTRGLTTRSVKPIEPIIKTKWGQTSPYNDSISQKTNICAYVAEAQILHYYRVNFYIEKHFLCSNLPVDLYPTTFDHDLIDREGENALIHGKAIVLFIPQIPYIEDYLRRNLYEFFRAQHFVMELIVKSREQEKTNYDENIN